MTKQITSRQRNYMIFRLKGAISAIEASKKFLMFKADFTFARELIMSIEKLIKRVKSRSKKEKE